MFLLNFNEDLGFMLKISRIIVLALIIWPISNASAQLNDLGLIEGLMSGTSSQQGDYIQPDENQDDLEQEQLMRKKRILPELEGNNFSYTGSDSFLSSQQDKNLQQTLKYFGYDFFIQAPNTFAQSTDIPIPMNYIIGPGDRVKIILFGTENKQFTTVVSRDGSINIPKIGPISVAGLEFADMQELINQSVTNKLIGTDVNVSLGRLRSINIFVFGEAYQPGQYSVGSLSTLTNAIFASGGIKVTGSLRNIQLKRKGEIVSELDFYDLLLNGDTKNDTRLQPGDVVFIPPITKTVAIAGEVGRSAIYELNTNENLSDLIHYAGNLKPKANLRKAEIIGVDVINGGFNLIEINITEIANRSIQLNNGDLVRIYPVTDSIKNAVLISGHARKPGFYSWNASMRIGDLLSSSDELLSMTDINYVLIKREERSSQHYEILQVDLEDIYMDINSAQNILLKEKDEIILIPRLVSPEQITTKLIQDKYVLEDEMMVLEEQEWTSLTYLRKSLMEETLDINVKGEYKVINPITGQEETDLDIKRFYEYSIYNYCVIPKELAISVIEGSGFRAKKSIPIEELESITDPEAFQQLIKEAEKERVKQSEFEADESQLTRNLSKLCRDTLIKPILELVNRDTEGNNSRVISIFGNVQFPGIYPLTSNMTLQDAIKSAGGFKEATYESEIELTRRAIDGKKFSTFNTIASNLNNSSMEQSLKPDDVVTVKQVDKNIKTVTITGEVYFSGQYSISENQTISELIERAGGITKYGSAKAAYFQRESLKEAELDRSKKAKAELSRKIVLSSQSGGIGQNVLTTIAINQLTQLLVNDGVDENSIGLGRLVVDLEAILDGDPLKDLYLEDGDTLHIPTTQQTVSVIGEVYVTNSHIFKDGLSLDDYINLSGGVTDYADLKSAYLVKIDGSIISPDQLSSGGFFRGNSRLDPGDTIVVPLQLQPFSSIKATTEITQIIYQMALAAAAVNSF